METLDQIRRLPETHQLCKEVKRRLLNNFKIMEKKKATKEKPSDAVSTTTTAVAEGLGPSGADDATLSSGDTQGAEQTRGSADDTQLPSSGADDAPLSSGDGAEQAQTSQTEVERLRRALADAEHAELMLHSENKQLQAKLLARQKTVQANEQDEAQLREKNRGLETENTMLRIKLASKTALAARRAQQAVQAKEKAQKMQSENDKLQEALAGKEHGSRALSEKIARLESNLLDTQARADSSGRECSQLRVVNEGLVSENANLRRRKAELEASASFRRTVKRPATGEGGGVSSKRGKIEDGGQLMCISNIYKNANEEGGSAGSSGPPRASAAPKPSSRLQVLLQMYIEQFIVDFFATLNNIIRRSDRRFRVKDNREEGLAPVEAVEETAAPPPTRSHVGPADERYVVLRRPPPDTLKSVVKHRDDRSDRHRQAKRIMMEQNAQVHEYDRGYTAHAPLRDNELGRDDIPFSHFGIQNPTLGYPANRRFTKEVSFEPENAEGMSHTVFSLPCSDSPVRGRSRWQPDKTVLKSKLKANVMIEIGKMVVHFQQMQFSDGMQYWLITDMLLKGLDETVVNHRSTFITRVEFPQLPIWITDGLRALQKQAVDITLTHVFLCLGFDLRFCYSGPTDTIVGMVVGEIERMIEWWKKSLVGRDVNHVREASTADVSVPCKIELPRFVLFTIPEVGDWNKGWRSVNENYRKWAEDYNRRHPTLVDTVEILDWAKMCEDKWGEKGQHRSTFEERVKLLMEHCNSEYGILLEGNNVDLVPFRRQLR
ncbi:hypothetical protein AAVH_29778 [Aphelenchoides avenae]|nr:hypothetical protein AAVH_29778 [Aphelenchus avenae]